MKTIHKFCIGQDVLGYNVAMPMGAKPIHAGLQDGDLMIWAEVERGRPCDSALKIWVVGTGFDLPEDATVYLGTIRPGVLVFHIYADWVIA